ncbi:MAG: ergothioneine biosynthesis protein EgtB [Gemmataceae bacterium]|nr:ergothioneine biosynthesis protein EgtB [Gemmataceae bacterium]
MSLATVSAADLAQLLTDARQRTRALFDALSDEQLTVPYLPIINPPLWEFGHVAWFQERWLLRHLRGWPPLWDRADDLYDSTAIAHVHRWRLPLPSRQGTLDYMQRVFDRVLDSLGPNEPEGAETYFHLLTLFHEDMHDEAFVYTRQTLGYPPPPGVPDPPAGGDTCFADVEIPSGMHWLGSTKETPFVFDNEKWAHLVEIDSFAMSRAPVTNGEFARFVEDGGYRRRELWDPQGWDWLVQAGPQHPLYWVRDGSCWRRRSYHRTVPLGEHVPVLHVNWYEADAYCRWAFRRLPTEAEWEWAACGPFKAAYPWGNEPPTPERANLDLSYNGPVPVSACPAGDTPAGCRQMIGNVWEWTASDFLPYPGFSADPYKEYSAPWFGTHKVLRGGSFATRSRLIRNVYRNFYTPDRRDVLAGFRTCAL